MSYILDALQKADRERKQGDVPDLKTSPPTAAQSVQHNRKIIRVVVFVSIMLTLIWLKPWQNQVSVKQSDQPVRATTPAGKREPATAPGTTEKTSVRPTPEKEMELPAKTMPAHQERASEPAGISNIMDLPAHIRNSLPPIQVSGHIFDEIPARRMVIINGHVKREGSYISDHLTLEKITKNGIVLNHDGILFSMTVFDSWSGR